MPDPTPPQTIIPVSAPEIAPATAGTKISEINIPVPASIEKAAGILGPKEAIGEDSVAEMERMEEQMTSGHKGKLKDRPRDEKGRLIPTAKEKETIQPQPDKKKETPVVKAKEAAQPEVKKTDLPPASKVEPLKPAEANAVEPEKIETPNAEAKKELTSEEKAKEAAAEVAAVAKKDQEWIEKEAEGYGLTQAQFDKMLADGDVKGFSMIIARAVLNARKYLANQMNALLDKQEKTLRPILDREGSIQQFQTESQFLEGNPEIKGHPEGLKTYREVASELRNAYDGIQQKVASGKATAKEKLWAANYDDLTPEQFGESVAYHTKARLAEKPQPETAKVEQPKPKAEPTKLQPKPFNGDRPGSAARVATESADARQLREMNERQGISPI